MYKTKQNNLVNVDIENGIKYGVIPSNAVLQAWADGSEPIFPDCECKKENCECLEFCDPIGFEFKDDEYECIQDEYGDIFIIKSPYYTLCRECSPCAPNAGYILSQDDLGYKAYCFGVDWFDGENEKPAIYRVSDNKKIEY